jgi:tRNA dimethylallyltransferase
MSADKKPKIIVILGTTASGKTKLGVALARQFNGEIISADSRQVYRGLDVGSGKDLSEYGEKNSPPFQGEARGGLPLSAKTFVPHHLIDIADPQDRYSVAAYQYDAFAAIDDILQRGKLPIIVGGSGQYLEAVVEGYELAEVKPDQSLRVDLEEKTAEELFKILQEKNPAFAEKLNNSDKNNKRRLIRYVEVFKNSPHNNKFPSSGGVDAPPLTGPFGSGRGGSARQGVPDKSDYDFILIGLTWPKEILAERIHQRLIDRLEKEGMIQEVSDLHDKAGLSWERLEEFGLEYKFIAQYLQEKIDYDQMVELLDRASNQFAKKQMTWFKRWEKKRKINWLEDKDDAEKKIKEFLVK